MPKPLRLLVVNPNTSAATTDAMVAIARGAAPEGVEIEGMTAPRGAPLITDPEALAMAADVVAGMAPAIRAHAPDGVIVAAFGDPGLAALRLGLAVPVVGIGEASIAAAARHGPFAVITTTPLLVDSIEGMVAATPWGGQFRGVFVTQGDPAPLMSNPAALTEALHGLAVTAIEAGAAAIVVGGGPLAVAARALKPMISAEIIEPVPEAVAELIRQTGAVTAS